MLRKSPAFTLVLAVALLACLIPAPRGEDRSAGGAQVRVGLTDTIQ